MKKVREYGTLSLCRCLFAVAMTALLWIAPAWADAAGSWSTVGQMVGETSGYSVGPMANGKVLAVGGDIFNPGGGGFLSQPNAQLFDPVTNTWGAAASLPEGVSQAAVTGLVNGKVLVAGGIKWTGPTFDSLSNGYVYDSDLNSWTVVSNSLSFSGGGGRGILLNNGKVLLTGGSAINLYDPVNNQFDYLANEGINIISKTLLVDGKVLLVGFQNSGPPEFSESIVSKLFDHDTNLFSASTTIQTGLSGPPGQSQLVTLGDGRALLVNYNEMEHSGFAKLYTPATGAWSDVVHPLFSLSYPPMARFSMVSLADGRALVVGSYEDNVNFQQVAFARLFDPTTNSWSDDSAPPLGVNFFNPILLANGKVLLPKTNGPSDLYTPGAFVALPPCAKPIGIYAPATSSTGSYQVAWNIINAANVTYKLYENNGITNTEIYSGPNNKFTVSGKTNGPYNYTVRASLAGYTDSPLTGPATTTVTVACGKIIGIYGPPTSITGNGYQISWNIVNTADVTYELYENNGTTNTLVYSGPNNKVIISGKTSGTYSYTVKATKAGITDSALAGPISTTIVVGPISGIFGPTSNISGNYNINWKMSVTTGVTYMLYENNGTTNTLAYSGPNNNFNVSGKTNGTYSYTVKATKAGLPDSALTGPISTTVFLACGNIYGFYVPTSSIFGSSYQISWYSATAGVTYELYEDNGSTNTLVYSGPNNNVTMSGKPIGIYSYTVKATKAGIPDSALAGPISTTVTDTCGNISGIYGPTTSINGSYQISWNSSGTDGVTYALYENNGTTNPLVYSGPNTNFTFSGKTNGTYSYTVKAIKAGGIDSALTGPISTTVTVSLGNIIGIYGPTTNISGSYQISWNTVNNSGVTYILYEDNGTTNTVVYSGPNNKVTLSGKTNGIYNYTVKATKAGWSDSPTRGPITSTVNLTCGSIIGIYGPTTSTSGYYKISWNRSVTAGVTYQLYENNGTNNNLIYSGPNNYVTHSDKANGTYSYTVKAIKAGIADSPIKGTVTTTVTVTCGSIPGISGPTTSTSGNYQISWGMSATAGVTYELYEDNGTANTLIYSGPNNNFNISGKTNGTYSYTVKATKAGRLDSPTRGTVNTAVTVTCGSIAGINAPTNSTGSYTVNWNSSATPLVTYVLEERVDSGSWTEVTPGPVTNSYDFTAKPAGTYDYRVTATKSGYNSSATTVLATPVTVTP